MAKILEKKHMQDWANLALAILLFISPWVLGFSTEQNPSVNAWVSAVVIGALALGAIGAFHEWEEWVSLIAGLWVVASPWILGFTAITFALWVHVVLGLLVAAAAAWEIWEVRHQPHVTA